MSQATMEFSSEPENLAEMRAFVRRFLQTEKVQEPAGELLVLGVDEACTNIIRHAYGGAPGQPITLTCERDGGTLRFRLRDFGLPVNPAEFQRRTPGQAEPGGLGLYFMAHIFNEATYLPRTPGTELLLVKQLG